MHLKQLTRKAATNENHLIGQFISRTNFEREENKRGEKRSAQDFVSLFFFIWEHVKNNKLQILTQKDQQIYTKTSSIQIWVLWNEDEAIETYMLYVQ